MPLDASGNDNACSFCLSGALLRVYGEIHPEIWDRVRAAIQKRTGMRLITIWNDDPETTYEDIIALVEEAGV